MTLTTIFICTTIIFAYFWIAEKRNIGRFIAFIKHNEKVKKKLLQYKDLQEEQDYDIQLMNNAKVEGRNIQEIEQIIIDRHNKMEAIHYKLYYICCNYGFKRLAKKMFLIK